MSKWVNRLKKYPPEALIDKMERHYKTFVGECKESQSLFFRAKNALVRNKKLNPYFHEALCRAYEIESRLCNGVMCQCGSNCLGDIFNEKPA